MILVTGATGTLGRDVVPALRARGAQTETLSRRSGSGSRVADLTTGVGLDAALEGVDTVVHLAVGSDQEGEARRLVAASERRGIRHLVFISIPGIDEIPFAYYRAKLAAERVVEASSVPSTVLRATQFHPFIVSTFFARQKALPVIFAPRLSVQPIDTRDVATRLAELALAEPQGRVADLGGPEILSGRELAEQWSAATFGRRKPIIEFSLPGATWKSFAAGHSLVPDHRASGRTFAEYLAS